MSDTNPSEPTVVIERLSDRIAPDGSWRVGDPHTVPVSHARDLIDKRLARLAHGHTLPPAPAAPAPAVDPPPREGSGS